MSPEDQLEDLLEVWQAASDRGQQVDLVVLCRDQPELLPLLKQRIEVLQKFQQLRRINSAETTVTQPSDGRDTSESASSDSPPMRYALPVPGSVVGQFRIISELGKGGMGVVYRARDTTLNRDVALKIMLPDLAQRTETVSRFLREARAMAAIRHDNVVEVYQADEFGGFPFVAMPLLAGETLQSRLTREGRLPVSEVHRMGAEIARGLDAVHARGLIHRDLKPSNIWLEAGSGRVKLLDFGLARDLAASDGVSVSGVIVGTPLYMSPEQANGSPLDGRSDLFSLGTILYEMAAGQTPFRAASLTSTLVAIAEKQPQSILELNPAVPVPLAILIQKLHAKRPEDRPVSAADVALEIQRIGEEKPLSHSSGRGFSRTHRGTLTLALTAGIAFIALGLFLSRIGKQPRSIDQDNGPVPLNGASSLKSRNIDPLKILDLDVHHYKATRNKKTSPRGVLGKDDSFGVELGDEIHFTSKLSRPAFAYLIMFQPDGKDAILFPRDEMTEPEPTESPGYPRSQNWQLAEGDGLCVIALIASDDPLPSYRVWRTNHPDVPWKPVEGQPDVVWKDDGVTLKPFGPDLTGTRAAKVAEDRLPIVRLVDWLRKESNATVAAVAFTVEKK